MKRFLAAMLSLALLFCGAAMAEDAFTSMFMNYLSSLRYGIADAEGNTIISADYTYTFADAEGFLHVYRDKSENGNLETPGCFDSEGNIIAPFGAYDQIDVFSEGLCAVRSNGKSGFIDGSGAVVIPLEYDEVYSFSEGLAAVRKDDHFGFIDTSGKLVIPLEYEKVSSFYEGSAWFRKEKAGWLWFPKSTQYGRIDQKGKVVMKTKYELSISGLDDYCGNYAITQDGDNEGLINRQGELIIPNRYRVRIIDGMDEFVFYAGENTDAEYDSIHTSGDGIFAVKKGDLCGYISEKGEVVLPLEEYSRADSFQNGFAVVAKNDQYGFINTAGELVVPMEYEYADDFSDGLAKVKKDGSFGFINASNDVIIPIQYGSAESFSGGIGYAGGKTFNTKGEVLKEGIRLSVNRVANGYLIFK